MHSHFVMHNDPMNIRNNVDKEIIGVGQTVFEILAAKDLLNDTGTRLVRKFPFIVCLNGKNLLEREFNTIVGHDDVVQVCRMPKGGGGGGSNLGAIVMAVVAAVMAYVTFGLSLVVSVAIGAAVGVGMSLLTGAVPEPRTNALGGGRGSASPTYNLNSQSNTARLLEAIPRVYGTMRVVPDLASQPYSEYDGNVQMLYQLFAVSLGDVDIDEIIIDNTPIESFEDATVEIIRPGQRVTLFPDNVLTSDAVQGIEMPTGGTVPGSTIIGPFVISESIDIDHIAMDFAWPRGIGKIDDMGNTRTHSVNIVGQFREVGTTAWLTFINETISGATQTPQFRTFKKKVAKGKYEVQAFKASGSATDNRSFDTVQWSSLRGYVDSVHTYGDMTLIATAMKATNALNSTTARKFYVTATSKLQTWNPVDGWGARVRTNSIAWAAADILRDREYGRGLPTSRFNMAHLYRLHGIWEARGDKFNGVFDSKSQLWAALSAVLRCGRATPVYYAGVIDFVRDEPQTIVTAQFTPALMVKNSFKSSYKFNSRETPDHIIVEYIDKNTWKSAEVACAFPGSAMLNPYRVTLRGCTDRNQAYREGMSMLASNRDRRRSVEFTTLEAGLIPEYNGLIRVQHDVPQWGFYGRVLSFDRITGKIRTTEPIPITPSLTNMIAFRKRNGSEDGPYTIVEDKSLNPENREFGCVVKGTENELGKIYISDGYKEDYTQYIAGPSEARGIRCLVISARPDSEGRVTISAINYADSVHTAENGGNVPTPPPESNLPAIEQQPIIDRVDVLYTVTMGEQNIVATVARSAIYYEFEAKAVGTNWQRLGQSDVPFLRSSLNPGQWSVRVRGVGRVVGPWTTWDGIIEATTLPTPRLATFNPSPKLFAIGLDWSYAEETRPICLRIEIRQGVTDNFGSSTPLIELPYPANAFTFDNLGPAEARFFWARVIDTAGRPGPWFNNGAAVRGISESNFEKVTSALIGKIGEEQLTQSVMDKINTPDVDLGPLYAEIDEVRLEQIDGDKALAQSIDSTLAIANGAYAQTQTNASSIAKTNGDLSAMYTIKTQITSNGIPYIAAIGTGVENTGGIVSSSVTMMADKLVLLNPNTNVAESPFMVVGGVTYLKEAYVNKITIMNALIGASLSSVATVPSGKYKGLPIMTTDYNSGVQTYRGVSFQRVDNVSGTKMYDNATNVVVLEWGDLD